MARFWRYVGAFTAHWTMCGCAVVATDDEGSPSVARQAVAGCSVDADCASGYVCAGIGSCVRPSNCYSGATGSGVFVGSLVIDAVDTQADIQALNGAWCVTGDLSLKKTALADAAGLSSIIAVAGNVSIEDNSQLGSLHGLEGLRRASKVALFRNGSLASLSALSKLNTLMSLQIYVNPRLTNLDGLQGVTTISWAEVVNNAGLSSLTGLGSIAKVYSYVDVRQNPQLVDVSGLNALTSVGNLVQIMDNPQLVTLQGLGSLATIGSTLRIGRNAKLMNLSALNQLTRAPTFQVADNATLDSCNVTELASRIGANCSGCVRNGPCLPPDHCPEDPAKLEPGICGCGVSDVDSDGDGEADCIDACPLDSPNDADGDGVCTSMDRCPGSDDKVDIDQNGAPDGCQECVVDLDCNDSNACTSDTCDAAECEHSVRAGASCGDHGSCTAAAECVEPRCRFVALGALPRDYPGSFANAVSDDGRVVTGRSTTWNGSQAFRWTEATGLIGLDQTTYSGQTISADGTKIAGEAINGYSFREQNGGIVLSEYPVTVRAGSADGRVLVGRYGNSAAIRWVDGSAFEVLGPQGIYGVSDSRLLGHLSVASGVSADGSTIVGKVVRSEGGPWEAFIWDESSGARYLGGLSDPANPFGAGNAVSPNGQVLVGDISVPFSATTHGFRWTEATGLTSLGAGFYPRSVTDTGMVVGRTSDFRAAVIGSSLGDGSLKLLLEGCGVAMTGWVLNEATDVTPDGRTIVGVGTNPSGGYEAVLVRLP